MEDEIRYRKSDNESLESIDQMIIILADCVVF
jgi:hypothetical protein